MKFGFRFRRMVEACLDRAHHELCDDEEDHDVNCNDDVLCRG